MTATQKPPGPSPYEYVGEEMTLWEHLQELRERIVKSAVAIAVGFLVGFIFLRPVQDLLIGPYCRLPASLRAGSVLFGSDGCRLVFTQVLGGFFVSLKSAAVVAAVFSAPVVCYQIWRFVSPGLRPVERRYAIPFILLTFVLFVTGAVVAYAIVTPGLHLLLAIGGEEFVPLLDANAYFSFILKMTLGFGLAFEVPMAIAILTLMGVIGPDGLRKHRRHAIFGMFLLGAIITPTTDPVGMSAMALPLVLMYEGNIVFARVVERRRRRRTSSELALAE